MVRGMDQSIHKGPNARGSAPRYFGKLSGVNDGKQASNLRVFYLERNPCFFSSHLSLFCKSPADWPLVGLEVSKDVHDVSSKTKTQLPNRTNHFA